MKEITISKHELIEVCSKAVKKVINETGKYDDHLDSLLKMLIGSAVSGTVINILFGDESDGE